MNRIISFFKGKGFYLALALCILAAAASSFWAIRNVMQRFGPNADSSLEQEGTQEWDLPDVQVEQKVNDVPVPSAKPSQPSSSASGSGEASAPAGDSGEAAAAPAPSFVQPVDGQITQVYSGDELVYNETLQDWRTHNGVDIACTENAPVKSAVAGTVCNIYDDGMWGRIVEVEAGELTWRYAGLAADSVQVSVGDGVSAGQTLGNVGEVMAETAGGPHLHLEVLKGGNRVDPEHYFG